MNNAINEIKNTLEATNSRITEAEDRISELEDRMVEIDESERIKEKRIKRSSCYGYWPLWWKLYFAPVEAGILEPQTCLKNTLVNFSLHCKNSSGQVLSFLKATSSTICLACFTGKSSDIQFHIIRETTGVVNKIHKTLSPDICFHGMIQCVIGMSLYGSETAGNMIFWTWEWD